jgi:hypothetical protein
MHNNAQLMSEICRKHISATDDGMIRVIGVDIEGITRYVFISPDSMEYEIGTMTLSAPGATLSIVG